MGVIIKYQLDFKDASFTVSNDVTQGDFIIDADIVAEMSRGATGSTFKITLYDLPEKQARALNDNLKDKKNPRVTIKLGYFDGPFELVMEGVYIEGKTTVSGDKLITTLKGVESGTNALLSTDLQSSIAGDTTIKDAVSQLLQQLPETEISRDPRLQNVTGTVRDPTFRARKLMQVLEDLAERAQSELLVLDKRVSIGKPLTDDGYGPVKLGRDLNLAVFQPFSKELSDELDQNVIDPLPASQVQGFEFTITGDPKLRPAHRVVPNVEKFGASSGLEFRVYCLSHRFSATAGYTCEGIATLVSTDGNVPRQADAACQRTASTIVRSLNRRLLQEQRQRPSVEIAAIKAYTAQKHLSTLYFGQKSARTETQPSVRTAVDNREDQLFLNKSIVSPFAWHKCGLVVPVYPGMKALLTHNLDLIDDALVTGFLWSETPNIDPPKNQDGDWWLCLPIDFDSSKPPTDSTKAVNDLVANNGKRVLEVKGLKVTVGGNSLRKVGERPAEGGDDEFLIEHASGTKLKIASDGTLSIEAKTLSIKADVTIEGNVEIK